MEDSVLLEEKDINVFNRLNKEANEKSEEFKADELFYLLNDYRGWVNALKPYIQGRIDTFRQMEEDFLN